MSAALEAILAGQFPAGLYRWHARQGTATIVAATNQAGWRCFVIDGRQMKNKASFLASLTQAINAPEWTGQNWDALEESLYDLSWAPAPGYIVLFEHADQAIKADPQSWAVAQAILSEAAVRWAAEQIPFFTLLRGPAQILTTIARL